MGRGRQKAKQTRIARKLKYLTTDTDYDELAKELSSQDGVTPSAADPFASIESQLHADDHENSVADTASNEDLDEYAQWAAEAAKKAEEKPVVKTPVRRKPIPMPMPSALKKTVDAKPAAPAHTDAVAPATDSPAKNSDVAQDEASVESEKKPAKKKTTSRRASTSSKTAVKKPAARKTTRKTKTKAAEEPAE